MLIFAFAIHFSFTFLIVLVNIFKVKAVNRLFFTPNNNGSASVPIKQLFRISSTAIFFSFIFSPVLSYALLRFSANNINSKKSSKQSARKGFFKAFGVEIAIDLIVATVFYLVAFSLAFDQQLKITFSILPIILISSALFLLLVILLAIYVFFNLHIFGIVASGFSYSQSFSKINFLWLKSLGFILVLIILKLVLILTRDFIFLSTLKEILELQSHFSNSISDIFRHVVVFNGTAYLQLLPFNMIMPELICGSKCSGVGFDYARRAIFVSGACLLLVSIALSRFSSKSLSNTL